MVVIYPPPLPPFPMSCLLHGQTPCPICVFASGMDYDPVEGLPGATWLQVRKNPTRALVRFAAGMGARCLPHSTIGDA